MLNTFRKAALRNAQYLEVMAELAARFAAIQSVTHRDWPTALATLTAAVQKLDLDFKQQVGSDLTQPISDADAARDRAYTAFAAIVRAQADAGQPDAVKLQKLVKRYAVDVRAQMDEESSLIKQLAQEINVIPIDKLARIGVLDLWIAVIDNTTTLSGLLSRRDDERATLQLGLVKTDRADIDAAYDRCETILNAALVYEPSQALTDAVAQANSYLNRVRTQMLSQSASESEEVSGTTPESPAPDDNGSQQQPSGNGGQQPSGGGSQSGNNGNDREGNEFDA